MSKSDACKNASLESVFKQVLSEFLTKDVISFTIIHFIFTINFFTKFDYCSILCYPDYIASVREQNNQIFISFIIIWECKNIKPFLVFKLCAPKCGYHSSMITLVRGITTKYLHCSCDHYKKLERSYHENNYMLSS